jgi:ABC-type glycerol-3-phosphate transport system substrate-binding protein
MGMPSDKLLRGSRRALLGAAMLVATAPLAGGAGAQELTIGYMPHPIQDANIAMMESWAEANGVNLVKVPMAYTLFMERVTANLTSGADQFDIIWHNDDWGQLWIDMLETTDDVAGIDDVDPRPLTAFYTTDGELTVVPMVHTVGTFFYRTDLLAEDEVPTTWDELVEVSKRLQEDGAVRWGYVGGMAMNHTWFTQWWSMWSNECDIFHPLFERDNQVLADNGWSAALADPCHQEVVEFWWDAMNTHNISPPGMTSYGRDEANAIFMAGDAAFTLVDSTHYGSFNDPSKSRVAGNVGMAKFPMGPRAEEPFAWNEIWGWGIPKGVPEERKALAKEMLGAMLQDIEGQVEQWNETGGPPPSMRAWEEIAKQDPVFEKLEEVVFDVSGKTHSAYYFPQWPAVHKAYSDGVITALTGSREDIGSNLEAAADLVHRAAAE